MTAIPSLPDLVREVLLDGLAGPRDPIRRIGEAERLAGELTHVGERLVGFFVEQARADGLSWADIGGPRGLTRQGAQQKYAPFLSHLAVDDLVEAGVLRPFGEAALAALRRAGGHAVRLGRDMVDSGDLFLGVLDDERSAAVAAIRELGLDPDELRSRLEEPQEGARQTAGSASRRDDRESAGRPGVGVVGDSGVAHGADAGADGESGRLVGVAGEGDGEAGRRVGATGEVDRGAGQLIGEVALGPEARRAIDGAMAEARGHLVAPSHLLLGMLRNPAGRAGRLLGAYGVSKSSALGAIVAVGSRQSAERR